MVPPALLPVRRPSRRTVLARAGTLAASAACGLLMAACGGTAGASLGAATGTASSSPSSRAVAPATSSQATASGTSVASNAGATTSTSAITSAASSSRPATTSSAAPAVNAGSKPGLTLQYYSQLNQRQTANQFYEKTVIQPFVQQYPNIAGVETIIASDNWDEKLTTLEAGGTPPDVVWEAYPETYMSHLILDVSSYVSRDKLDMAIYPKYAFEYDCTWRGKILGLPCQSGGSWPVTPYNRDVFQKAGVPEPPQTWGLPSWNYDSFVQAGKQLTQRKSDGTVSSYAISTIGAVYHVYYWALRYGGQWLSDDFTTITCDTPEVIQSLQDLVDLAIKHQIMPAPGKNPFQGNGQAQLQNGQLAMLVTAGGGTFIVSQVDAQGGNLGFTVHPTLPKSTGSWQDMDPNGLATGSKHLEEGWSFIRYLSDTPNWAVSRGNLPARSDHTAAWEKAVFGDVGAKARVQVYENSLSASAKLDPIGVLPNSTDMITKVITPAINQVFAGQAGAAATLQGLKPVLQAQVPKNLPD